VATLHRLHSDIRDALGVVRGRSLLLGSLTGVMGFDYADRTLIGAMGPSLKHAFNLSNTGLGLLVTLVGVVGALATLPVGVLTDRWNRVRILTISLGLWTAAMVFVGADTSFLMLVAGRLLLGIVTASAGPTVPSLVGDTVRPRDRSKGLAWINMGQVAGTGLAYLVAAAATGFLSFRWGFWCLAIGSGLLTVEMLRVPEPKRRSSGGMPEERSRDEPGNDESVVAAIVRRRGIRPAEQSIVRTSPARMSLRQAAIYTFKVRTDVVVMVARSVADYFYAGVGTFAVVFATDQYSISEQQADMAVLSLGVGALAGLLVLAGLADGLLSRGVLNARIWVAAAGLAVAPLVLLPSFLTHELYIALPSIIGSTFFLVGSGPVLDAVRVDVLVPRLRGRGEAIREVFRSLAEGGAPLLFGVLSGLLAARGGEGLRLGFLVTLPTLPAAAGLLLVASRTYGPDIAAALEGTTAGH
jgi:predicted MFS family arabinose efflux permease